MVSQTVEIRCKTPCKTLSKRIAKLRLLPPFLEQSWITPIFSSIFPTLPSNLSTHLPAPPTPSKYQFIHYSTPPTTTITNKI